MFTGIIEKIARVTRVNGPGPRLAIVTGWQDLDLGESIAVNGVCLTVAEAASDGNALFFLSEETLSRSNLGGLREGSIVNLERALPAGARLSGHIVQGHVDGIARLTTFQTQSESHLLEVELPASLAKYCVEKGSVALDGVSLTINRIENSQISLTLIPHSWKHTRFSALKPGDEINVEVDILAKYTEKLCQPYLQH